MSVLGSSDLWRVALVDVYDLVCTTIQRLWPDCRTRLQSQQLLPRPRRGARKGKFRTPLEDPITRELIVHLRRDEAIRRRLIINSQVELLPSAADVPAGPLGYLDIAIEFFAQADQVCLAVECKRLNIPRAKGCATLAGPYVKQGLMRFVSGQYSAHVPLGGMIGYVMNGEVEKAYDAVREQIEANAKELLCDTAKIVDTHRPMSFRSEHRRPGTPIEIGHTLLSMN